MNIALEQTEEYVNGKLTNSYGDAFVRGNNGKSRTHIKSNPIRLNIKSDLIPDIAVLYISKLS